MSPDDPDAAIASWANAHPTGRVGEPEDVAKLVLFLVGDGARLISGGTILADSGLIAGSAGW
jgi:NAD(P)-dependent dehydrogenase (short-subunit alcohol dehydrogenase family)